jgi:hypothetical protein
VVVVVQPITVEPLALVEMVVGAPVARLLVTEPLEPQIQVAVVVLAGPTTGLVALVGMVGLVWSF